MFQAKEKGMNKSLHIFFNPTLRMTALIEEQKKLK